MGYGWGVGTVGYGTGGYGEVVCETPAAPAAPEAPAPRPEDAPDVTVEVVVETPKTREEELEEAARVWGW